jgi:hypothetical protein
VFDLEGKKLDPGKPIIGGTQQDDTVTGIMTQIDDRMTGINKANEKLGELLKEREIIYGKAPKTEKNPKIKERKMFKEANERFNKTDMVADTVTKIISMEPVAALKEANKIIGRKGIYKNLTEEQSQKILKDTDDWIFQRDPSDLYDYKNKRPFRDDPNFDPDDPDFDPEQGFYTGGMVDVEPNLSDIGHGSDSLMARTRLISPNNQATTSTGLNYLLAEDNDNIRVPFSAGGGGRRAFLKLLAALGGGIAGIKSGILGLGEGAGKKAVTETIKKSAGSSTPPPYFFELMETITKNGREIKSYGERVKQTVAPSKDGKSELLMTEDLNTGSVQIKKIHKEGDDMVTKSEEMTYTKNMGDESTQGKPADDYEEITEYNSRIYKDNFNEPDFVEGVDVESIIKEVDVNPQDVGKIKYKPRADGGRIGFSVGNLAKLGITGSSRRFLEKVFGKENLETMIKRDPEMHRGLLEVVEMFRNRDKEGLKMYMQKFLPHMDDATVEDFIIGGGGTEGIQGQLIRLGSGRDYAGKLEMMKKADNMRKLDALDVKDMKPNANGGLITMLGE